MRAPDGFGRPGTRAWTLLFETPMNILLLVNPYSSSVTPRVRVAVQRLLKRDHDVRVVETSRRDHAARVSRGAASDGTDIVVVLGGDGTLNEAANGLVGSSCALAPLPGGSTNVFARTLGLPDDPVESTEVLLEAIAHARIRSVGLGAVNGRYFLFHVGVGFDAAVVEQVERRGWWKRWAGHPLFMYSAFDTWLRRYDRVNPTMALHHSDGTVADAFFTIVANTNPYTYLGAKPFNVAREAGLDRPLASVAINTMQFTPFIRVIAQALLSERPLSTSPHVDYRVDLDRLVIRGHRPMPYQVDGDFLGEVEELRFEHRPDAIRLVEPAGSSGN